MITKEEMISKIYEKVSDKTLSFGCKIQEFYEGKNYTHIIINIVNKNEKYYYIRYEDGIGNFNKLTTKIIGHPIMIGDVLDYIDSIEFNHPNDFIKWHKEKYPIIIDTLFTDWKEKRKSIEEQSDDCITYVYNLIK